MKKILIILFFLLAVYVHAEVPTLNTCLNDFSGVINIEEQSVIKNQCDMLYSETGVEVAVLLTNFSEEIDSYAIDVFEKNQIGEKNKDTGMLILVNTQDNDWIILVGYGLEGVLNDAKLANVGRAYLEPAIDEGNYGEGVYQTLGILGALIYESGEFKKEKNFWKDNWHILLAILILIILLIITKGRIFFLPNIIKGFGGGRTGGGRGKR